MIRLLLFACSMNRSAHSSAYSFVSSVDAAAKAALWCCYYPLGCLHAGFIACHCLQTVVQSCTCVSLLPPPPSQPSCPPHSPKFGVSLSVQTDAMIPGDGLLLPSSKLQPSPSLPCHSMLSVYKLLSRLLENFVDPYLPLPTSPNQVLPPFQPNQKTSKYVKNSTLPCRLSNSA